MDKKDILQALAEVRSKSPKRKFNQSLDLIITLRLVDLKKTPNQIDVFLSMPHDRGKKVSIGAFVQTELEAQAKDNCEEVIHIDNFTKFEGNKKEIRRLVNKHDFFIAQAPIMPQVAKVFGRLLGPRNKMPNPKVGCVVPPTAQLKPLVNRLRKTVRVLIKTQPMFQVFVGKDDMKDDDLADNILTIYKAILAKLPNEEQNVKSLLLKFTMGPVVRVGSKGKPAAEGTLPKAEKKETSKEKVVEKQEKPAKETKKEESKPEEKEEPKEEKKGSEEEEKKETEVKSNG